MADIKAGEQLALALIERMHHFRSSCEFGWIIRDLVEAASSNAPVPQGRIIGFCGMIGEQALRADPITKVEIEYRENLLGSFSL
jgi:hypothetical protein